MNAGVVLSPAWEQWASDRMAAGVAPEVARGAARLRQARGETPAAVIRAINATIAAAHQERQS